MSVKISVAVFVIIISVAGLMIVFATGGSNNTAPETVETVIENGKQIITITAKGGYSPRNVTAQAGIPTLLRIKTNSTFDCSASLLIPKLGVNATLQPTGTKEIDISAAMAKGKIDG